MPRRGENIYKRKDGRWEGRYIRGRTPAGKAEYGYVYAKSYAACREKRRKMEGVIPQKPTLTGEMSVAQAVAFFLSDRRGELKASTVGRYEYVISHYIVPDLGTVMLHELTAEKLSAYFKRLQNRGLSSKTARDTANKPSNSGGKKDDNKKNDQKGEDSNTPAPTPEQKPESKKNTVTITIRCDTAVNNGMHLESKWAGIVPASGVILPVTTVEIEEGDTVFDVLAFVCEKYKIHMSYRGGTSSGCYVDGINNLYEFDGGRWSGWMYCVNDWYPNYGCGVYYVKPGEVIEWNYTCDLGCDLENGDPYGYGKEWKDNHD